MDYVVLVTGSRDWPNRGLVYLSLDYAYCEAEELCRRMVLRHGYCPTGADAQADGWAAQMNALGFHIEVERHPADWSLGRSAGYKRNAEMVALGVDVCLAFILDESKGSSNTAKIAKKAGIHTVIFEEIR